MRGRGSSWANASAIDRRCGAQFSLLTAAALDGSTGADSTGATGNFAPVLTQEPGKTLRFVPVPFMAVIF